MTPLPRMPTPGLRTVVRLLDVGGLALALLCAVDGTPRTAPELACCTRTCSRRVSASQATVLLLQLVRSGDVARHGEPYTYTLTPLGEQRREASRTGLSAACARTLLALGPEPRSGAEVARRVAAEHGVAVAVTYAPLYRLVTLGLATRCSIEFGDGYARSRAGEERVADARVVLDYLTWCSAEVLAADLTGGTAQDVRYLTCPEAE